MLQSDIGDVEREGGEEDSTDGGEHHVGGGDGGDGGEVAGDVASKVALGRLHLDVVARRRSGSSGESNFLGSSSESSKHFGLLIGCFVFV